MIKQKSSVANSSSLRSHCMQKTHKTEMMKVVLVLAAIVLLVSAEPPVGGYGGGSSSFGAIPNRRSDDAVEISSDGSSADNYVPQLFKHVYVHSAPDEAPQRENRVIRVPGGDKHVNIVFIKSPSQSSQAQTEVILPQQDQHKSLVYVLLKKNEAENNIKVTRPKPRKQPEPEVNFIRYSDSSAQPSPAATYGTPSAAPAAQPVRSPNPVYSTPAHVPQAQPVRSVYGTPADVPAIRTPSRTYGTPFQ